MPAINKINIALTDDHALVRSGLKSLLEAMGNYEVKFEASNGLELITQLRAATALPHLCIIDMSMGPLNGYETILVIKKKWPQLKVIMLSMYDHELLIAKMMQAGASGCLPKNIATAELRVAINDVLQKGYYYTEAVSKIVFQKTNNKNVTPEITDKELRFLCLCCSDMGYKEIADKMGVEIRTVDNYRDSLFDKLNKHTRAGLAVFATASGLTNLSTEYLSTSGMLNEV